MEYKNEQHSCLECIWHDQCESKTTCSFFDNGRLENELPSDDEMKKIIEQKRKDYRNEYFEYTKGWGNYDE